MHQSDVTPNGLLCNHLTAKSY